MASFLETKVLRNFVAVATTGSISKAADVCYVAQPALSLQMRSLEEQLQVSLFERSNKGVILTAAGELLLDHAIRILAQVEQAVGEVKELELTPRGNVSIGMPLSIAKFIAAPLIERSAELYPEVFIQVLEISSGYVPDMLVKGEVDLGITFKKTEEKGLVCEEMMTEKLAVIAPQEMVPHAISGIDFIRNYPELPYVFPPKNHGLRDVIARIERKMNVNFNVLAEINTISLLIDLSLNGTAATILSHASVLDLKDEPSIFLTLLDDPEINRSVFLCHSALRKNHLATKVIKELMLELTNTLMKKSDVE